MKMNLDCIRDILLCLENMPYSTEIHVSKIIERLTQYNEDEIEYNLLKMYEAGFIKGITFSSLRSPELLAYVSDITFKGHEFLNEIREQKVFSQVKNTCKKVGSFSINTVSQIATNVISEIISKNFL